MFNYGLTPSGFQLSGSVDESRDNPSSWKDILDARILRPISIGLVLMVVQQGSGMFPITAYTVDIFHSAGTDINDNLSTNIVGVIQVVTHFTFLLTFTSLTRHASAQPPLNRKLHYDDLEI